MEEQLGVAIVGSGFMGTTHLTGWSMVPEAKVISISDVIGPKKIEKKTAEARKYKIKYHKDYREALEDKKVDVVDICTPTYTHKHIAVDASQAGKHVMVEKPIALTLRDADAMIDAAARTGVKLMVAHAIRFFSEYQKIKELIDKGTLGEPIIARALRAGPLPEWSTKSWFLDQKLSGGVGVDLAIHDIDFTRWAFSDEVKKVYARVGRFVRKDAAMDDHALMILRFKKGGIAHIQASWAVPQEYPFTYSYELAGTKSFVEFNNHSTTPITVMSKRGVERFSPVMEKWVPGMPFPIDPYYGEIRHFADCLLTDRQPMTDGKVGRSALEIALAAQRSSKIGKPIHLPLEV